MNKKLILAVFSLLVSAGMNARTSTVVGLGGAMGALGGDISTIGTNPAGIGIFRSNDAAISFGFSSVGTESKYGGNTFNAEKNRWQLDNAGFVLSNKIGNQTVLRYVNFGFNYLRARSCCFADLSDGVSGGRNVGLWL